jgi:formate-dependent nitrite reductase membrane component NrfD
MMDLQSLANIGEIIGAVVVVLSLVYLAIQVRQNTQAQRMENYARALERLAAMAGVYRQIAATGFDRIGD